jgi:hypothetical protein
MKKSTKKQEKKKTARRKIRSYKARTKKVNKKELKRRTRTRKRHKGGSYADAALGFAVGAAAVALPFGAPVAAATGAVTLAGVTALDYSKLCECPGCAECQKPGTWWTPVCDRRRECCRGRIPWRPLAAQVGPEGESMCHECLANSKERQRLTEVLTADQWGDSVDPGTVLLGEPVPPLQGTMVPEFISDEDWDAEVEAIRTGEQLPGLVPGEFLGMDYVDGWRGRGAGGAGGGRKKTKKK